MKKRQPETVSENISSAGRLRRYPIETGTIISVLRAAIAILIRGLLRVYTRFEIVGHENIRTNRSLVIVANHSSHLDAVCLLAALPLGKLPRAYSAAAED
jgi:1-acyl-sn-glycerol-3-phosphate acyltransferase